jgi:hypothetical protein
MSRKIKFRVWNNNTNRYASTELNYYFVIDQRINAYEYEQFTGLKDKNGKEIYEGDIIKARDWDGDWGKYRIKWKQSHCAFEAFECRKHGKWNWTLQGFGGIEVIGNIHENPELLEGKNE